MSKAIVSVGVIALGLLAGCRGPEVVISHPLVSGQVEPNHIVHSARWREGQSGLPEGSLADEATLEALTAEKACFRVTMRVPNDAALDLFRATPVARVPNGGIIPRAEVQATQPAVKTYDGLIPKEVQTGVTRSCTNTDPHTGACRSWSETPTYGTRYVPGIVRIREQGAHICFANVGVISPASKQLDLEITQDGRRAAIFRWGLGPQ